MSAPKVVVTIHGIRTRGEWQKRITPHLAAHGLVPYHIGYGWFGGFLPFLASALVVLTGNIYFGLWYPIAIAAMSGIVGIIGLRETKDVDIRS